jgi:hypothetical protein
MVGRRVATDRSVRHRIERLTAVGLIFATAIF